MLENSTSKLAETSTTIAALSSVKRIFTWITLARVPNKDSSLRRQVVVYFFLLHFFVSFSYWINFFLVEHFFFLYNSVIGTPPYSSGNFPMCEGVNIRVLFTVAKEGINVKGEAHSIQIQGRKKKQMRDFVKVALPFHVILFYKE